MNILGKRKKKTPGLLHWEYIIISSLNLESRITCSGSLFSGTLFSIPIIHPDGFPENAGHCSDKATITGPNYRS